MPQCIVISGDRLHGDVIKWKQFPRHRPFVRGIHQSPVNSPRKGQWRGALMFSLICARINGWENTPEAGDLRRHPTHCDVIVMVFHRFQRPLTVPLQGLCKVTVKGSLRRTPQICAASPASTTREKGFVSLSDRTSYHEFLKSLEAAWFALTYWGRVTHICVSNLTIIVSDNGLSPGRRQAIIWNNAGILSIGLVGTNFSEILIEILTFSFKKMRLKVSSAKWRPFCLGLNVLRIARSLCNQNGVSAALLPYYCQNFKWRDCTRSYDKSSYWHWNAPQPLTSPRFQISWLPEYATVIQMVMEAISSVNQHLLYTITVYALYGSAKAWGEFGMSLCSDHRGTKMTVSCPVH